MLETTLWIVLVMLSIAVLLCFIRVVKGPTMSDRILAIDLLGINMIGIIGLIMIIQDTLVYVDVLLVLGIIAFIGSIALSKFIERGIVVDRDNN
ncbi:Na(+)/H(+) antiporter subunit F1 [Aquibacillus koreensis]|uniref:Na(+)/H(+) antiporter subunit F1 n=1 Tax=Aquibacillus koreensis TaxID=279446 RepID=A0A9X3WNX1_9BACI|nr:Na(+)/H(+) antiporter subunit F1 [Aquibacillus koreensis]MCT2538200.1 Na(+)/H(+) antiporter subunit F1 [Aquibacillus koreensis]MDC3420856.1 Na(+)/H(+) antiporter subunit F1 [Aquibacillus koreensis]